MSNAPVSVMTLLYLGGELNIGKAAIALAMVDDELDELMVSTMENKGLKAVITRAGGRGDNLISKILRNSVQAAINEKIVPDTPSGKQAVCLCVEKALGALDAPLLPMCGAGVKIGITSRDGDLAVGFFGTLGVPGLDADSFVTGLGTLKGISKGIS